MLAGIADDQPTHDLIAHLCQQIAALRQIAAEHSPGEPSAQLHRQHARELVTLLESHRAELRALLGGDTQDTEQDDGPDRPDSLGA